MNNYATVILEFLEVAIHTLLHSRKLYPEGIFKMKRKYGVPVHLYEKKSEMVKFKERFELTMKDPNVSVHPDLNRYISNTLIAIKHLLISQDLKQVDVCFFTDLGVLIERFVFDFKDILVSSIEDLEESSFLQLKESFRAFCLKLSVNSSYMKPLPKGSTFRVFIHTAEASSVSMSENPLFQQFPWIEAEKRDVTIENSQIYPVRNIETDIMKIHIYSEENPSLKSSLSKPVETYSYS